jgi:peptidoglycan-associated lipoprotein
MRNRHLLLFLAFLLAAVVAAGCAKRQQLSKSQTDQLEAIAAKIAKAEQMGAMECAPKELAYTQAEYAHARHEAYESWENAQAYIRKADKAADELLEKTRRCLEAKQPKPAPPPVEAPTPAPSPPPAPAPAPAPAEEAMKFENIRFDFDKSFLREDAKPILQAVAAYLKKNPGAKLLIEGHCDERGTPEYNMALGDRRAHSAMKYLEGLGVQGSRMSTISYGEQQPLDPGHDEAAWAKNRRAVFVLQ